MTGAPRLIERHLPPLAKPKSPGLAALIGVLTGGIGLAVYFRSIRDLFPVEVAVGISVIGSLAFGVNPLRVGQIVAPVAGGLYGYWRAQSSNRRLAIPAAAVGSAV
jgi:hypothetical protein